MGWQGWQFLRGGEGGGICIRRRDKGGGGNGLVFFLRGVGGGVEGEMNSLRNRGGWFEEVGGIWLVGDKGTYFPGKQICDFLKIREKGFVREVCCLVLPNRGWQGWEDVRLETGCWFRDVCILPWGRGRSRSRVFREGRG